MLARRVSARDSGKPMVDAAFGEVMVTCEKLAWLAREGERHLRPERRSAGAMVGPPQPLIWLGMTLSHKERQPRAMPWHSCVWRLKLPSSLLPPT